MAVVVHLTENLSTFSAGADPVGEIGAIAPPKAYESNFFHHNFVQFGKTLECELRLECQKLLKSPPLNLRAGSAPGSQCILCDILSYK